MKRSNLRSMRYRLVLIVFVIFAITAVSVSAYYVKRSDVTNRFTPAESTDPPINETFENNVKEDVSAGAGDTGYPVYVRAEIVVTWQDSDGTVFFVKPEINQDYELTLELDLGKTGKGWIEGADGYYYYQTPVESSDMTTRLVVRCEPVAGAITPLGYTLNVEIIVQTVQAIGTTDGDGENPDTEIPAYKDAWGISETLGTNGTQKPENTPDPDDNP